MEEQEKIQPETVVENTAKKNKAWAIIKKTFGWLAVAVLTFLVVAVGWLAIDKFLIGSPVPSFLGYAQLTVETGSMSGTIEEKDVIIIKKTGKYKIGDIVTYLPEGYDVPTTHRIIQVNGDGTFVTRGDANSADDTVNVSQQIILGEVVCVLPRLGIFYEWLRVDGGWMYFVAGFAILVLGVCVLRMSGNSAPEQTETDSEEPAEKAEEIEEKQDE